MSALFTRTALACMVALSACVAAGAVQAKAKPRKHSKVVPDKAPDVVIYGQREDVMRFAAEAAARRELDVDATRAALAQAKYIPSVARLIMPPPAGTAKNWGAYRSRFVEPVRLKAGAAFWSANEAWLRLAEERYGVPPEIIVGIVGVETIYGQQMGSFRIIDALATLSFDFPAGRKDRSAFFRDELENYLLLCRQQGVDPLSWRGSYAGAIGMPQFMPSSILAHAVDFDGDGHIDLHNNPADVIGSVAHFLSNHGWQRGMPTRYDVSVPVDTAQRALLLAPDILPSFTPQEFAGHGAVLDESGKAHPGKLALVELQNGDAAPTYVAGTENFYAITRYNWSSYYALAVISLGEAIKRQRPPLASEPVPAPALPASAPMAADPVAAVPAQSPASAPEPAASAAPASLPASGVAPMPPAEPASR
ncbi:lytic murein transglycosylase B [Piscinibacter terrae]|uniref:Lytic murein transglycosylase B n=1 Tax=Piscinibacter terrae TaxID=2496871 RepID=A0A3N7HP03_9BURK|nr:lytic murein transglycosylase B [Albitalea terrae]RQP23850.1 lytic murein transglycosylase B [Albitalea terrae]